MRLSVLGMETSMSGFSMLQASSPLPPGQTGHLPPKGTAFLFQFLGPHSKPPPEKSGVEETSLPFNYHLLSYSAPHKQCTVFRLRFTAQKNTPMGRSVFLFRMISSLIFPRYIKEIIRLFLLQYVRARGWWGFVRPFCREHRVGDNG